MASAKGRESFMENSTERADQIVRVDASALLKTIRELEYKLTEQQKPDKAPAWATALEQRIEQLENTFFQAQSKINNADERVQALDPNDAPPLEHKLEEKAPDAEPTAEHSQPSPSKAPVEHKEEETHKRSVVDFATEMRVIGKVRKEIDNKFHTAELHLDTKMSSFNLQLERLMKLLQIRPTTSELQTVMNAVYDVDKKVANSMDEIKNDMRTQLKTNLSVEITSIIDEVKQANNLSESGIKYIQNTVDGFASNLTDLREVTENTVVLMNEAVEKLQQHNSGLEDHVARMRAQLDKQIQEQAGELAALKADHATLFEEFTQYRNKTDEDAARLAMEAAEDKAKLEEEIARLDYELAEANALIQANAAQLLAQQSKAEADLAAQAKVNQLVKDTLAEHLFKLDKLRKEVDALIAHDTPTKVHDLQEELKKSNINIASCAESIDRYINGDLKTLNVKVSLLQEQCNIQIPNAYGEMSIRIDTIAEQLVSSNKVIDKTMVRLQSTDDTVGELMPLLDRVTTLETHSGNHLHELSGLKASLTNTIDTTDELMRRLEETEETVEGLEGSVTNRMNQMRDSLIDTILEKQIETNTAMRNVRDNLEVMARAGEGPITSSSVNQLTAPGARPSASMQSGVSSKMSSVGQSTKANPPVMIAVPGQAAGAAQLTSPVAIQMPSSQSMKVSTASRKQSSGTRASVSSEVSDTFDPDDFGGGGGGGSSGGGGGFNSNTSVTSGSQPSVVDVGSMQRNAVAAYQRPSMAGQEIRGGAPPIMQRQPSISGASPNAVLSRQLSNKMSISESAPSLTMHSAQPRYSSPTPAHHSNQQNPYQNFDLDASPDPDRFSQTILPDNNTGRNDSNPSPRVSSSAQRPGQQPQYQSSNPAPVTYAQPAPSQRAAPAAAPTPQGQIRYVPPPQTDTTPKYQLHPQYQHQPGIMDAVDPTDALYVPQEYQHFQQALFLADLCLNFEEISVKRKRVANVPTVMCESIADIAQDIAEFMAKAADFEMVQYMLSSVAGLTSAQDLDYDENMVLTKRNQKIEEYLAAMTNLIILTSKNQQPGIVRMDARSLFVSLVKKSLDMFMSKHNQVLVVGNSRLGRVKIPSCLACDRPLIDKVRLDNAASRGGTRGHDHLSSQSQLSTANPSQHHIMGLAGFNPNPSIASYGFGAPPETNAGDGDEDESPTTPTTGMPAIHHKKPASAAHSANNPRKRTAADGKLPEVQ